MLQLPIEQDKRFPPTLLQTNVLRSLMYKGLRGRGMSWWYLSLWDFCQWLPQTLRRVYVAWYCLAPSPGLLFFSLHWAESNHTVGLANKEALHQLGSRPCLTLLMKRG